MHDAIKAIGDLELEVLGAPYGVDRAGQEFHAGTNFGDAPVVPALYWHGWGETGTKRIGWAYKGKRDERGQWYRVVLDRGSDVARRIYDSATKGLARASSDAISHLVEPQGILGKRGRIDTWIIGALSLMDAETYDTAVNPRAIAMPALRAFYTEFLDGQEQQAGEAMKAGAALAKRNRDRIVELQGRLKEAQSWLDELMQEFPQEPSGTPMTVAASNGEQVEIVSLAVKAIGEQDMDKATANEEVKVETVEAPKTEVTVETPATKAEPVAITLSIEADSLVNSAIKAAVDAATAVKPEPAVKSYTEAEVRAMLEKAAGEAAKASQRLPFPAIVKAEADWADPMPFTWAVKAAKQTGGSITFNLRSVRKDAMEFDGTADAVKAFKAMATTASGAVGEHFVPRIQTDLVTQALYQSVISRTLPQVNVFPMPGLVCDAPSIGAFSAGWSAENNSATSAGDAATNRKTLIAKNLTSLATVSNQLLADSNPEIERYIREGIAAAMGEAHDTGAFYGTNSANQPLGITGTSSVTSTAISTDDVYTAVIKAVGRMAANKLPVSPSNTAIIMRPEVVVKTLTTRVGSSGDFIASNSANTNTQFLGVRIEDRLSARFGYPVFSTTVIPAATGTITSSVLVLYCPDFVIGDRQEMEIAASNIAGSAFANNQTLIRAIMRVDFLLLRAASLEIITGVAH